MSNIFEDKSMMPEDRTDDRAFQRNPGPPIGGSVAVIMTPERELLYRATSYPASDSMSIRHVERPRRGHDV